MPNLRDEYENNFFAIFYIVSGGVVPFFARMCVHMIEGATEL